MKTLPRLLLASSLTLALALAAATDASAYKLSPPDASVRLHGKMTFTPNEGGTPFTCGVTLDLKTQKGEITDVKFTKGTSHCEGINFQELPWYIGIFNANSGSFSFESFVSNDGDCHGIANKFQVNQSGVWTFLTGQCLSGTLTSTPLTTIVP